ncbi:hypothetical protein HHI36_009892 [Cryptolaemus montrouzieri]|uniref:Uncharacterized protein n=1 Tax=Cryptolaemus montrouzieri TaxID=559131 RepID=A0ABD2MH31_9CUCU
MLAIFLCLCLIHVIHAANHQHLDECVKSTGVKITPDVLRKLHEANKGGTFDINSIPQEMLCLPKCVLEKREVIDSKGKISIEKLKDEPVMKRIPNKKTFLDCMGKINVIGNCDDIKQVIQCRIDSQ